MKKIWVLFLSLFVVFGIVSCNNSNPTEIEYNLNEQLEVPSNLSVNESTKTLTWDAVENAVRYNVYVDGELEDEVTTTSFDFSSIAGDRIMFTVKAMAPKGMVNSNMSTTIAYVANREGEISQMKLSIQASSMTVTDEDAFATELVNKGMLSEDFDAMMVEIEDMETVLNMTDVSDIYDEFDQLIATMDMAMIEALISSLIKVELRSLIQSQLDYYESRSTYPGMEQSIEQLEDLLQFIDDKGDDAVKSAMIVIGYLVDVQNSIDTELVASMETLMNSNDLTSANVSVLVNVKNELITNLKDNLPELQDVIVLNSTLVAFMNVIGEVTMDTSIVSIPKQSAQSLMSMELFYNFVLEMDEDYMNALFDAEDAVTPEDAKPFVKENIRLIDQYLENNDILIQQLNNIYTDEEKEALFYGYYVNTLMGSYYDMILGYGYSNPSISEELSTIIEEQLDFDNIMMLQASMGETFNELLDAIIESDYAVIDAFYQVAAMSDSTGFIQSNDDFGGSLDFGIVTELQPGQYRVSVRGLSSYETGPYDFYIYADYGNGMELIQSSSDLLEANVENEYTFTLTEAALVQTYTVSNLDTFGTLEKIQDNSQDQISEVEAVGNLMKETVALINPILQNTTVEEYNAMVDLLFSQLIIQYEMQALAMDSEYNNFEEMIVVIGYIETGVKNTSINQFNIFKNLVNLLDQTNYIDDFVDLYDSAEAFGDSDEYYGAMILFANAYLDFYNDSQNDIDAMIEEVMLVLNEPDVRIQFNLTTTDINEIETTMNNFFTDLNDQANMIKDYDYTNLTAAQQANVDTFVYVMTGLMFMM